MSSPAPGPLPTPKAGDHYRQFGADVLILAVSEGKVSFCCRQPGHRYTPPLTITLAKFLDFQQRGLVERGAPR